MQLRSPWRRVALVAAIIGAGISTYLLVEYLNSSGGICLTGGGCDEVRLSQFAYPLGLPMPLYGLVFYLAAAWVALRSVSRDPLAGLAPRTVLLALGVAGAAVSAVLTGLEAFVIGAFCTWCLAQAAASLVLLAGAAGLWLGRPDQARASVGTSRRAQRRAAQEFDEERASLRRNGLLTAGAMAILVAGLLAGGALGSSGSATPSYEPGLAVTGAPREGSGAVTVVEFADFECPACAAAAPELQQLVNENLITLVFRYFPLSQHQNADLAARAAAAANLQGKFWPMHDLLFSTQAQWQNLANPTATAYFTQLATQAGLDVQRWTSDLGTSAVAKAVQTDLNSATALQLPGTPTIFINGTVYNGSLSISALRAAVTAAGGAVPSGG